MMLILMLMDGLILGDPSAHTLSPMNRLFMDDGDDDDGQEDGKDGEDGEDGEVGINDKDGMDGHEDFYKDET